MRSFEAKLKDLFVREIGSLFARARATERFSNRALLSLSLSKVPSFNTQRDIYVVEVPSFTIQRRHYDVIKIIKITYCSHIYIYFSTHATSAYLQTCFNWERILRLHEIARSTSQLSPAWAATKQTRTWSIYRVFIKIRCCCFQDCRNHACIFIFIRRRGQFFALIDYLGTGFLQPIVQILDILFIL